MNRLPRTVTEIVLAVAGLVFSTFASSLDFPARSIRLIVPQAAGSGGDLRARQVAQKLADALEQSVVVDNRPGANSAIGARLAANAAPDGYTLLSCNINNALNDLFNPDESCRLTRAFLPITRLTAGPLIMVIHPSVPAASLKEFLYLVRSKPKLLTYASTGKGSITQLLGEMIKSRTAIDLIEVPYKSTGAQVPDLLGGHLTAAFDFYSVIGPYIKNGKLRSLAVAGLTRLAVLPDTLTTAEAGLPGVVATAWNGICAPAGTPAPRISLLHREIVKALNSPLIREQIISSGAEIGGERPEQFAAFILAEVVKWDRVAKDSGIVTQ